MSLASMAIYAERARILQDPWLASGRYVGQAAALPAMLADISEKLALGPQDDLLDIGAGTGMLSLPLAQRVARTMAVDHPDCLARLPASATSICRLPGDALKLAFPRCSKVLIYDMVHYLGSAEEVLQLMRKAIGALVAGGRMLVGDLPNEDKRARFAHSDFGALFERQWRAEPHDDGSAALSLPPDPQLVRVDDHLVLAMLSQARALGCDAYVLPQRDELPFGFVREDVLVVRP